jgi:predicted alpha/beta-fold hydrolase
MSVWAKDDPLLSEDMFPLEELLQNDNIILVSTDKGGHLGWNEGLLLPSRTHWFERLAMDYFRLLLKTQKHSN